MKKPTQFKLTEGEKLNRNPNKPIISLQHGFLWIGNDAEGDKCCFATLSGKKTLLKLAAEIKRAALR
jgi:hypothetical protein